MQDNQDSGHFSQEELDAIVSGTVTPKMPVDLGTPQEQSPDKPIWDTADVALSVPRGVVGFGKSIYNLADTVSFDLLPDWHTNPLGSSQSHVGGLVEGLSQFVSGFATGGLALRGAALVPGAVGKAAAWLGGAGGGAAGVIRGGMVKGGIADFISFEGAEGRLSDILVEFDNPVLNNTVTQYLASDMDDSELEGRLKNVLEGAVLGVALEGIVAGVKGSAKAIRKYRQAKAAGVPEEDAVRAAMEVAGDDLEEARSLLEAPPEEDVFEPGAAVASSRVDDLISRSNLLDDRGYGSIIHPGDDTEVAAASAIKTVLDSVDVPRKYLNSVESFDYLADAINTILLQRSKDSADYLIKAQQMAKALADGTASVDDVVLAAKKLGYKGFPENLKLEIEETVSKTDILEIMDRVDEAAPVADEAAPAVSEREPSSPRTRSSGGPNYGVEETRRVNVPEATAASVRELEDLINTGAGADVIAARIEQLREQGIINLRPVIQSGTPGAYAEALVALRQVEANEGRFGPTARRSNAENTRAGMAQLQAAMESGGLNVPEVMKAIQDGVATIKDFNERLPFFLGLEAAFRYEAVQALRSGRGDTDEVMRAFTMVSGSTRRIKSYLGKNLQMIQAFGDMDVVRRSWESLDPKQRRVLMNQYADTLEMLVVDPQTGKEMAKVLTEGMVTKGGRIGAELFRNSILSGPKTLAVNIWSAVEALALPMERGLGRLGAGQRDQALREFGTLARYSSEAKDALTAFKTSFMEEGDSVALGRGNTQFGDLQPSRAIASRNFARLNSVDPATGGVRRTIAGLAVDFVGQVVNMPMRAMGSSDEFFTTMMARAEADVVLRRIVSQERKLPMTSSAVSLEVERLKKLLFVDGQLYTRRTVVERGMRLARDKHLPESFRETLTDSVAARMELDRTDPAVVSEVSRLFNQAVSNNKVKPASELRKSKDATVLIQSLDAAGQRARANPMFIPEVQRYVDQNWDAYADSDYMQAGLGKNLQQQTGQDYRLLQKASAEVERRVREATWKREYDDMAESSVLGTQLVGNIGKATASAVSHVPLLQLVVPFIRTPTNLLAFVTDRNPVGRAYSWWQAAKAGDKDAAAEAAGRLATGTVLYTTGIVLAANGMITGRGPKDPDLRKQLLASGWQPYAFRFGDTYISYGRNDPISTFLGLVADTYEIAANTYDPTPEDQDALMKVATAVVGSVANNVTNKSYLRGIVTTLGALTGDEAEWQKLQRQYAGALVPNFLAQVDQTTLDPDIREVRSMMDAIRSRVPVFGETVDRLRNPLGEPIKGNETAYSIFLPGTASTRTKDPVKRELADSLISVGSPRSTLPGGIDLRSIKLKNGQSAYDRLQELTGQVKVGGKTVRDQLAALIQSPFYKELPALGQDDISSPRVSLVRGYVGNYRKAAMQQLLKESPELARAVAHSRELKASMLR